MNEYILSIDSGTTGVTILIVDKNLKVVDKYYSEINQYYPHPGWVEHDPNELIIIIKKLLNKAYNKYDFKSIKSIGITNQRETTVVWNKNSGEPIYNAIVWQCRRTKDYCDSISTKYKETIFEKTGLYIDSYFSASKINWILNHNKTNRNQDEKNLLFGTIDTWIIWNLTNKEHATDFTNASRTMLFNINDKKWDNDLLDIFNIPINILPSVKNSMDSYGYVEFKDNKIPINGVAGDQQAALFGQGCINKGDSKCTYGTGLFYLYNSGKIRIDSKNGLLTTLSIDNNGLPSYAIEGSVFIGGALIQWLRDELKIIKTAQETEKIAQSINSTNGVFIIPAFVGLGAPHWNSECKGIISGLTRGTNRKHIIRAALESICYQVNDLLACIKNDCNIKLKKLNVDGGATNNDFLMQFQADISNISILRPGNIESTAIGAAILAGLKSKFWLDASEAFNKKNINKKFIPSIDSLDRKNLLSQWQSTIKLINK